LGDLHLGGCNIVFVDSSSLSDAASMIYLQVEGGCKMALSQAQYLMMLAEDKRARGDVLNHRIRQEMSEFYQELLDDAALINRAKEVMDAQLARFQQWAPRQEAQGQLQRIAPTRKAAE
jgi:hypothetical protein